jgi:hypothetical protein
MIRKARRHRKSRACEDDLIASESGTFVIQVLLAVSLAFGPFTV